MKKSILVFLIAILPVLSFAQTYTGSEEDINRILENIESFSEYVVGGDYEGIANAYTEDAKIMVNGRDIIEGREKIKDYWTPGGEAQTIFHKIHPVEIEVKEDRAYDYGRYEGKTKLPNGEVVSWQGKYVIIWKKTEGDWKIYVDIWNSTE